MVEENKVEGAARNVGGKIQEAVGGLAGDAATQVRGKSNQAAGAAQDALGSAADAATEWTETLAGAVKDRPLTALLVAVSVGYVLRMLIQSGRR